MRNTVSGAEACVRMLELFGVDYIFGLCGDSSLPLYDALFRLDHGITHVLCRDERSAAYMADAYARVSGKVGVCEGPSGGGATYIAPGLAEANESSIPVLSLTTDIATSARGRYVLTELDQKTLFRPLTKWNEVLDRAEDVPRVIRRAFTEMTTGRPGAAHIGFPFDVQTGSLPSEDLWADARYGAYPSYRWSPEADAVAAAARLLQEAELPVIVCGGGVLLSGAEDQLRQLAERIGAPVATTISGQGSLPDDHPLSVGVVGSNGGVAATRDVVKAADLVMFIGCRAGSVTTEHWRCPDASAKVVHLDVDPAVIGANYRTDVPLMGDARLALQQLLAASEADAPGRDKAEAAVHRARTAKQEAFAPLSRSAETPIRPERFILELSEVLPEDALIVADPGTPCPYVSAYYPIRRAGRSVISNRAHGALGYALSAAVGAHFGRPDAKCVSIMGDGSFGFTIGEMETVVRWNLPILFIVVSNDTYGWIKAGQKSGFEGRYFSVDFTATDHRRVAEAYGLRAWRVTDPDDLRQVLARAAAQDGPALVDVVCQPLHEAAAPVSEWVA